MPDATPSAAPALSATRGDDACDVALNRGMIRRVWWMPWRERVVVHLTEEPCPRPAVGQVVMVCRHCGHETVLNLCARDLTVARSGGMVCEACNDRDGSLRYMEVTFDA